MDRSGPLPPTGEPPLRDPRLTILPEYCTVGYQYDYVAWAKSLAGAAACLRFLCADAIAPDRIGDGISGTCESEPALHGRDRVVHRAAYHWFHCLAAEARQHSTSASIASQFPMPRRPSRGGLNTNPAETTRHALWAGQWSSECTCTCS